jgi:hypothetical protein
VWCSGGCASISIAGAQAGLGMCGEGSSNPRITAPVHHCRRARDESSGVRMALGRRKNSARLLERAAMKRVERPTVTKWRLSRLHPTENTATTQEPALTFAPWLLADSTFQMSTASPAGSFSSLESSRQSQHIFCPALWRPSRCCAYSANHVRRFNGANLLVDWASHA